MKTKVTWLVNRHPVNINGKWKSGQTANNSHQIEKCIMCNASPSSYVSNKFQKSTNGSLLLILYQTWVKLMVMTPRSRSDAAKSPGNSCPSLHGDGEWACQESQMERVTGGCDPAPCHLSNHLWWEIHQWARDALWQTTSFLSSALLFYSNTVADILSSTTGQTQQILQ